MIKNVLINGIPYHDSLNIHFGNIQYNTTISINDGGYENLKSRGFEIISNDSTRKAIINFYETSPEFLASLSEKNNKISIEQFIPEYKVYFSDFERHTRTVMCHLSR